MKERREKIKKIKEKRVEEYSGLNRTRSTNKRWKSKVEAGMVQKWKQKRYRIGSMRRDLFGNEPQKIKNGMEREVDESGG